MAKVGLNEDNIVWSGKDFKLCDFVENYPPPQIVKVEEGYLDDIEEERTLSASQLLTLHHISEFITVIANDFRNREFAIPTASKANVEIICKPSYYNNVKELPTEALPQYVACQEKHPWLNLEKDDVLEIKKPVKSFRSMNLLCVNVSNGHEVSLPIDYSARFKALGQCPVLNPTMADIANYCEFPCVVRFLDNKMKISRERFNASYPVGMNQLGPLTLRSSTHHKVVFSTTWEDERRVIPLPLDLEIRVVAAHGAINNDTGYSKLCKIAHKKIKSEELVLKFYSQREYKIILEDQEPVIKVKSDFDDMSYCDVAPMVPPRSRKPGSEGSAGAVGLQGRHSKPLRPRTISLDDDPEARGNYKSKPIRRSISLHLPTFESEEEHIDNSRLDDVFAKSVSKDHQGSILSSAKKVLQDLKESSITGSFRKALPHPKLNFLRKKNKGHPECSDISSNADTSHASCRPSTRYPKPEYNEITPLPGNIAADRRNEPFFAIAQVSPKNKENVSGCKIRNPDKINTWTINEVSECLRYFNLGEYIETFQTEKIDGCLLAELDEESLNSLGVTDKLHITKLLKIIDGWFPKQDEAGYIYMGDNLL